MSYQEQYIQKVDISNDLDLNANWATYYNYGSGTTDGTALTFPSGYRYLVVISLWNTDPAANSSLGFVASDYYGILRVMPNEGQSQISLMLLGGSVMYLRFKTAAGTAYWNVYGLRKAI